MNVYYCLIYDSRIFRNGSERISFRCSIVNVEVYNSWDRSGCGNENSQVNTRFFVLIFRIFYIFQKRRYPVDDWRIPVVRWIIYFSSWRRRVLIWDRNCVDVCRRWVRVKVVGSFGWINCMDGIVRVELPISQWVSNCVLVLNVTFRNCLSCWISLRFRIYNYREWNWYFLISPIFKHSNHGCSTVRYCRGFFLFRCCTLIPRRVSCCCFS